MTYEERSDGELLLAWANGDAQAGDQLVLRHFSAVFRFFRTKVGDAADELTQRTFLGCIEKRDRIDPDRDFRAYLFGIARYTLFHHLRDHYGGEQLEPHRTSAHELGCKPGPITTRERERLVLEALSRLPLDLQITLELFYWWGMSVQQIAETTEVAVGTVKSRLSRARATLKEQIEKLEADDGLKRETIGDLERLLTQPPGDENPA